LPVRSKRVETLTLLPWVGLWLALPGFYQRPLPPPRAVLTEL